MRIAEIIGNVTLSRWHPSLQGAVWRVGVMLSQENLVTQSGPRSEPFVIYDELNTGNGSIVAVSDGAEAANPFHPNQKPIDAYAAAILDEIRIDEGRETRD